MVGLYVHHVEELLEADMNEAPEYELKLMYNPRKYKTFFKYYQDDNMYHTFANGEGFNIYDRQLVIPDKKITFEALQDKIRNLNSISQENFNELHELFYPLLKAKALPYSKIYLLVVLNQFFQTFSLKDRDRLIADEGSNRSFTDLCSLAFYYGLLKKESDIIPFFVAVVEMIGINTLSVGYCFNIDRFVFQLGTSYRYSTALMFGNSTKPTDLCRFEYWPFITTDNLELCIDEDGEPEYPEEENYDEDDDDYYEENNYY